MTVSSTVREAQSACNGVTTMFAVGFQFQPGALKVYLIDNATLVQTLLTGGVHYAVSGDGAAGTAQVTTTAAYPSTKSLLRRRDTPLTQQREYSENDGFPAKLHEGGLDQLTMILQEQQEEIATALEGDPLLRGDLASIAGGSLITLVDGRSLQEAIDGIEEGGVGDVTSAQLAAALAPKADAAAVSAALATKADAAAVSTALGTKADAAATNTALAGKVAEAPADGILRARKDGAWAIVPASGGGADAQLRTDMTAAAGAAISDTGVSQPGSLSAGYTTLYNDLITRWWDTSNNRIWGMYGSWNGDHAGRPSGPQTWEWTMAIFHMNLYWAAKRGSSDAVTKIGQNFSELLARRGQSFLSTVNTVDPSQYIGATDDLAWLLTYFCQVNDITNNATALTIAQNLYTSGLAAFDDPADKGAGLLYTTDGYSAVVGHYRVSATNDIFIALAGLYLDAKQGTTSRRAFATATYNWIKQYATHPLGVIYTEVDVDPAHAGTPKKQDTTPPSPIVPHYPYTSIAFTFAFMTLCKKLNDLVPNAQYIADINNTLSAVLRPDTFLRPGDLLLPDRDGWGNGLGFPQFVAEVLPLAGLDAGNVAKVKRAIVNTALLICKQRTDPFYFNDGFTYGAGLYGADWTGPEMGTNGVVTWFQTGNNSAPNIALPEQIMTNGSTALVVTAASMIASPPAASTQLVTWPELIVRLQTIAQTYVPVLADVKLRGWLGAKVFYPDGKPGSGYFVGTTVQGNPQIGFDDQDYFLYNKPGNLGAFYVGGVLRLYYNSGGSAAIGSLSATENVYAGTTSDLNFGMLASGNNRSVNFDNQDYMMFDRANDRLNFFIAGSQRFRIATGSTTANDVFVAQSGLQITSGGAAIVGNTTIDGYFNVKNDYGPFTDGGCNIGNAAFRFGTVFAATGSINTSDAREKLWLGGLDPALDRVAARIVAEIGMYQWLSAIALKGAGARFHFGARAQAVFAAFTAEGLDPTDFGGCCYDQWAAVPATDVAPACEAGDRYGVRPDELLLLIVAYLGRKQATLETRIAALEAA